GPLLRRPPRQPAAADHRQGRRPAAWRRPHRLPDGLLLRPRLPAGQQGRPGPDPHHPQPGRLPPLHPGVRRLRPAGAVRPSRQRRLPGGQGRDAGPVHLHPAGDQGGPAADAAPQEADRRRAHPGAHDGAGPGARAGGATGLQHAAAARPGRADDAGLGDQGHPRPRRRRRGRLRRLRRDPDDGRRLLRRHRRHHPGGGRRPGAVRGPGGL
ncbi:MAG: Hypothetical YciO protein, TsaC/YrdC paralog, partial [uncultured Friedmanniella sp.]